MFFSLSLSLLFFSAIFNRTLSRMNPENVNLGEGCPETWRLHSSLHPANILLNMQCASKSTVFALLPEDPYRAPAGFAPSHVPFTHCSGDSGGCCVRFPQSESHSRMMGAKDAPKEAPPQRRPPTSPLGTHCWYLRGLLRLVRRWDFRRAPHCSKSS